MKRLSTVAFFLYSFLFKLFFYWKNIMATPLSIHPIPILNDNYVWTIIDEATKTAVIVDPGEAAAVHAFLQQNQLTLKAILITHHHWDHTNGINELKNWYDVPVFGPASEKITNVTHPLYNQDTVNIAPFPLNLKVMTIPGHTLDHIAYYAPGLLFCGDTLFAAGCGRLFEGTAEQMYASLQKMASLPSETRVYCAHEYTLNNLRFAKEAEPHNIHITERMQKVAGLREQNQVSLPSTLSDEKATNPFLRCDSAELIANVEKKSGKKLTHPVEIFAELRKWKDQF